MPASEQAGVDAGFTLIEVMVSLALFALIAVAGMTLLDGIIGVQSRTEGRLDQLADLQRAMFVVSSDLDQVTRGEIGGGGQTLQFSRVAPGFGGAATPVRYDLGAGALIRTAGRAPQALLAGVTAARWRFFDGQWIDRWPPSEDAKGRWPRAIALELTVGGMPGAAGTLRRVVVLPAQPRDAPTAPLPVPAQAT